VRVAVLAAALAGAYGVTDEWHQTFTPGRDASLADVVKDLAGAVLGAWGFRKLVPLVAARVETPA
jgi:VanZ family protein